MIIENINVYDLVPSQINEMIEKLKSAMEVIKHRKVTISKVAFFEKSKPDCPYCCSTNVVKNGHTKTGIQTYKCKDCNKRFNDLTGTVFSGTHLTYEHIEIFIQCFNDKVSLRKTAARMNVDKNTVHLLRLKFINSFKEIRKNIKLMGEVEADEFYRSINLKGTKPEKMPRASKPRTSNGTATRGINNHKVCIVSAVDEYDNSFFEIAGNGPVTSQMIKQFLTPKMGKISKLITDCKSSYESEAKINKWNLKQIKSDGYVDADGNSLSNINSLHSSITTFLAPFRGVSTKHMQGYLDWFTFDKYMQYSFNENQHLQILLKETIVKSTEIKTSNMYSNQSGLDFNSIYSDYNYICHHA